jgi:RloB-like protein
LCEGAKTEPNYFNSIKYDRDLSRKLLATQIEVYDCKFNTSFELVKKAKELMDTGKKQKNPYEEVWVVVDRDGYTKHPASSKMANDLGIKIAFSSPCFEFWILLHYEYSTAAHDNCDAVISKLKQHIPSYEKAKGVYAHLKDKTEIAIRNETKMLAHYKQIDDDRLWNRNPYSDTGELVARLVGKENLIEERRKSLGRN